MANSDFARRQMRKHGWVEGSGLGKQEDGMSEPIKVSLKMDKTGVGHDPGKEFTDHWWLRVFNEAAKKIGKTKESSENGKSAEASKKKAENKKKFYSGFVKGSTLTNGIEEIEEKQSDSEDEDTKNESTSIPTLDEIYQFCGGATGHKAARFGIKMKGKLSRVAKHDEIFKEKVKGKKGTSASSVDVDKTQATEEDNQTSTDSNNTDRKKKKKRKKNKTEDVSINEDVALNATGITEPGLQTADLEVNNELDNTDIKGKGKKKKRKREKNVSCSVDLTEQSVEIVDTSKQCNNGKENTEFDQNVSETKKRKKKHKKRKVEESLSPQIVEESKDENSGDKDKHKKRKKKSSDFGENNEKSVKKQKIEESAFSQLRCETKKKSKKKKKS